MPVLKGTVDGINWIPLQSGPPGPAGPAGPAGADGPPGAGLDQATADGLYVNATGDTMTGDLILSGDPIADLQAATKQYVDIMLRDLDDVYVNASGDEMVGAFHVDGDFAVDSLLVEGGSDFSGTKLAGVGTPAAATDGANKSYVDSRIWKGTQVAYDAIVTKDPTVLYVVTG